MTLAGIYASMAFGATSIHICHAKRQSDVLGGWVGKAIFVMAWRSCSKEDPISKEKVL